MLVGSGVGLFVCLCCFVVCCCGFFVVRFFVFCFSFFGLFGLLGFLVVVLLVFWLFVVSCVLWVAFCCCGGVFFCVFLLLVFGFCWCGFVLGWGCFCFFFFLGVCGVSFFSVVLGWVVGVCVLSCLVCGVSCCVFGFCWVVCVVRCFCVGFGFVCGSFGVFSGLLGYISWCVFPLGWYRVGVIPEGDQCLVCAFWGFCFFVWSECVVCCGLVCGVVGCRVSSVYVFVFASGFLLCIASCPDEFVLGRARGGGWVGCFLFRWEL